MPFFDRDLTQLVARLKEAGAEGDGDALAGGRDLETLLGLAARRRASDLLLVSGAPPALRVAGRLVLLSGGPLGGEDTRGMLLPLLEPRQREALDRNRTLRLCFSKEGLGRFRLTLHHQRGTLAGSLRLLPAAIPSLGSLHLPSRLRTLTELRQGLVLLAGESGSGRSSTAAALIGLINGQRGEHIVTIGDPLEFLHGSDRGVVEQIEVGRDTPDTVSSVRHLLREAPGVLLVDEVREADTWKALLSAAEVGHLVLATWIAGDAVQAVGRLLDAFPVGERPAMRAHLARTLAGVVVQKLVPAADGAGRWPALEILIGSQEVRALIQQGQEHLLPEVMASRRAEGMCTVAQSLAELVRAGRITGEVARLHGAEASDGDGRD